MTKLRFTQLAVLLVLCLSVTASFSKDAVFSTRKGAIKGYDPVAYFTVGQATRGKKEYSYEWMGANWLFSSAGNLSLFKRNPEKYAPQYGGYCAYGMVDGKKISINPDSFVIHDGKLYLNYNRRIQNLWIQAKEAYIGKADQRFVIEYAES